MDEGDVEAAMQWSRRTGLWSAGDTRFLEFLRMLVRGETYTGSGGAH